MPRIPYVDPQAVSDPEIRGYLERARREGTPRPESQAIRAHKPNVIRAFSQAWELTFHQGVLDHTVKELCRGGSRRWASVTARCSGTPPPG